MVVATSATTATKKTTKWRELKTIASGRLGRGGGRLGEVWARSSRMVGRRIGDQYVLVRLAKRGADLDAYLNLNRVAAFVWEQLDGERRGRDVVEALLGSFAVDREQAEKDYLELLETLVELDAVRPVARQER